MRALAAWQSAAGIAACPVFRRIWLPRQAQPGEPPSPAPHRQPADHALGGGRHRQIPRRGGRVRRAGFGGHSLKRGALTTGMDRGVHPAKLKRLGRHKGFDVLGEYLEFGDLFEATRSTACFDARPSVAVLVTIDAAQAG